MINNEQNREKISTYIVSKTSLERLEEFFKETIEESMQDDNELFKIYFEKCKALGFDRPKKDLNIEEEEFPDFGGIQ